VDAARFPSLINYNRKTQTKTMADEEKTGTIRLKSSDGQSFELSEKAASISELCRDSPRDEDEEVTEIAVLRVSGETLAKVVEYMKHYAEQTMKEIPTPLGGSSFNEVRIDDALVGLL